MSDRILGWKLGPACREGLLARLVPAYSETVADHVTWGRRWKAPPLPHADSAVVVGRADDGQGVEALVVEIDGSTERWDGGTYHVTWSLVPGRKGQGKQRRDRRTRLGAARGPRETVVTPGEWP